LGLFTHRNYVVRLIGTSGTQGVVRTRMNCGEQYDFFCDKWCAGRMVTWQSMIFVTRSLHVLWKINAQSGGAIPVGPYVLCENSANFYSISC